MLVNGVVDHVVVLMLENRAFDHLLGFLKEENPEIEGINGACWNAFDPTDPNSEKVYAFKCNNDSYYCTAPDPGHELDDTNVVLFGSKNVPNPAVARNNGFLLRYSQNQLNGGAMPRDFAKRIMSCFDPDYIDVISDLARNFILCDQWFSSVPGPTWPNRFFAHAGTSGGHAESPSNWDAFRSWVSPSGYVELPTLYEKLDEKNVPWAIYYGDISHAENIGTIAQSTNIAPFEENFFARVADGSLPNYVFIEPRFFGSSANDQHPDHDVRHGEDLIARVYNALRGSNLWSRTLFVVVYDEHGGFYDHVPPPAAVRPDGNAFSGQKWNLPDFAFDRLGVRVPAILISPWALKGRVDHTRYDHTSLLATVRNLFKLSGPLTKRDEAANDFTKSNCWTADPRTDTPEQLEVMSPAEAAAAERPTSPDLSGFKKSLVLAHAYRSAAQATPNANPADLHAAVAEMLPGTKAPVDEKLAQLDENGALDFIRNV